MAARRAVQAKAAALATGAENLRLAPQTNASGGNRLKSTSMTNLVSPHFSARPIQRPASRNALDNIHKGMNAKFTHVQSKVLLQNIRPAGDAKAASSKIPPAGGTLRATARGRGQTLTPTLTGGGRPAGSQQSERSQLINRVKALQEELASGELAREELKLELERERADKLEQVGQLKGELEAKAAAGERHNEDYHQKLLEAYELADQNRRAADSVLSESRQREEELRKRIEELEQQLGELREFVAVKEEMMSKMGELREQMRTERERYEEQTRTLNQLFASEKISAPAHMRVDQNSNYFRRAKPALQSLESIDQIESPQAHRAQANSNNNNNNADSSDLYGSKLSTRMQDGAKFAWKKSRKFASSVITGSLGGLAACRKRPEGGLAAPRASADCALPTMAQSYQQRGASAEAIVTQQPRAPSESEQRRQQQQQQHTSVVEVGEEPQQVEAQRRRQQQQQICVDQNNKLTIVTTFNGAQAAPTAGEHPQQQPQAPASSASSDRSRCESSSSGRGTASDSGDSADSSGSQNGDAAPPEPLEKVRATADDELATTPTSGEQDGSADCRRHERKSSLFKASVEAAAAPATGEQNGVGPAALNKSLRSFFAMAAASQTTPGEDDEARRARGQSGELTFQPLPPVEAFKQMRDVVAAPAAGH